MDLPSIISHAEQQLNNPDTDTRALAESLLAVVVELQGERDIVVEFLDTSNLGTHRQDLLATLTQRTQVRPVGRRSASAYTTPEVAATTNAVEALEARAAEVRAAFAASGPGDYVPGPEYAMGIEAAADLLRAPHQRGTHPMATCDPTAHTVDDGSDPSQRLQDLAREVTPVLMLDAARLNTEQTLWTILGADGPETCQDLTIDEAARLTMLVDDLASRADIDIDLPADD